MNRYGKRLEMHYRTHRAVDLEQLSAPQEFFSRLGLEIAERVDERADQIAGTMSPTASFVDRMGLLGEARFTAESEVMAHFQEAHLDL